MKRAAAIAAVLCLVVPVAQARRHHRYRPHRTPATLFPSLHGVVPPDPGGSPQAPASDPGTPPPAPGDPAPAPSYPARTGVDEGEYYVHIAHLTLAAGTVELNVHNYGQDDHDVTIDDADGHQVAQAYLTPGADAQLTPTLAPGTYRVYCSLYGGSHDQAGMHASLVVK